jgi:2-keto-3-deoxy-L-rhamnonate aldolase RhmA
MMERGFKFITVGSDLGLVREGVTATLRALKQ